MTHQPPTKRILLTALIAIALCAAWWALRRLDPTSSAIFISDSPDRKYRCAVFCNDTIFSGHPEYSAGLFQGHWPHHELAGPRAQWNYDSVSSSDFFPVWHPRAIEIDFRTGYGDERATVSGLDTAGSQAWLGPSGK